MNNLNIVTVCGFGIGSSLILKMTVDTVLEQEGIQAEAQPHDVTSCTGVKADFMLTSHELYEQIVDKVTCPVIVIDNFIDEDEVREKILKQINER